MQCRLSSTVCENFWSRPGKGIGLSYCLWQSGLQMTLLARHMGIPPIFSFLVATQLGLGTAPLLFLSMGLRMQ